MSINHARVVVIGGGIMGCSVAYHLAREGWSDVVLLEKAELTSGSTWHAAGQITHSLGNYAIARMAGYGIKLYQSLEAETGQSVTFHKCGSLRMAYTDDECDYLRQIMSVGRTLGHPMELLMPDEIASLHPYYKLEGIKEALHTPDDGHLDPAGGTFALAAGARQMGVTIIRNNRVIGTTQEPSGDWRVTTENGDWICSHIVNAAGTYARQVGQMAGLDLPVVNALHQYLVTDTIPELAVRDIELPVVRDDHKVSGYIRQEQNAGLIGIYEKQPPPIVWTEGTPWEAEHELFDDNLESVMPWLEAALDAVPLFAEAGIKKVINGAIAHPPDGSMLLGPAAGTRNYWCACGIPVGIAWGPGAGKYLAQWMVHGAADINMRPFDPRRYGPWTSHEWAIEKTREDYVLRHETPFPHRDRPAGRPVRSGPLYERLKKRGAVYEEISGWERPQWFAREGVTPKHYYSFRRNVVHDVVGAEVRAVRERVGIMDISAFAKIEVTGPDATALLDRLTANRLPDKVGGIALTHMLNRCGRIELETLVVKLDDDRFYLVCAAFFEQRLLDHLAHQCASEDIEIINRSDSWAALALNGPKARDVLAACTDASLDNADFRWLTAKKIAIAVHECLVLRMSYAGELGWEFHIPRENTLAIYDALWEAGEAYDIADYGSFAMNAMRLEKGFKGAGELTNEVTLPEADVMRFVKTDKAYLGKEETLARTDDLPWVCAYLEIEPDGVMDGHGGEAVLLNEQVIGSIASVAYGHTVNKILAFVYIEPHAAEPGTALQVVIAGEPRSAKVLGEPAYDPAGLLPRSEALEVAAQ